ncbi:MAG: hypothetical protein VB092_09515 [Oscillospiraceae bacterium]|nr:hypothetical protein [Oscillospiraceae bacterium]
MAFKSQRMVHADGRMHHLGTLEGDVAPAMLLTAGVEEVRDIAALLDNAGQTGLYREYLTYKGEKDGAPVGVMSSGHGCMPMAIAVEELNHLGVKTLVKVGAGAAVISGIKPGTIIIPTAAVRGEGATKEYVGLEYPAVADMALLDDVIDAAYDAGERPVCGIIRSHDSYYVENPVSQGAAEKNARWAQLGVLLTENEVSSMFVVAAILRLRAAAVYVVEENLADGTALSESELKERLDACYRIALRAAIKSAR